MERWLTRRSRPEDFLSGRANGFIKVARSYETLTDPNGNHRDLKDVR